MENRHQHYDLAQLQSLPLEAKILATKRRIREWYEYWDGMVYVSFSGGKDSTVLKHLVDSMYDDVPSVFVDTGLEYPEIRKFAMSFPSVIVLRPEKRFDEVIRDYGYPVISKEVSKNVQYARQGGETNVHYKKLFGLLEYNGVKSRFNCQKYSYLFDAPFKISHKCCDVMKKTPVHKYERETGRKPFIGTMACESQQRQTAWIRTGCNAFDSPRPSSAPLSFWTEQDILLYLKKYSVPYCEVYGKIITTDQSEKFIAADQLVIAGTEQEGTLITTGAKRTGCMFCMFGAHLEEYPGRFVRMKTTHPKQYAYCMKPVEEGGLGLDEVLTFIGVPH